MTDKDWLAQQFEAHRPHLRAVAYRMLGAASEAEDAVQETWIRLSRADADAVDNLGGWLTTVVARVSLDMLRSRAARREEPIDTAAPDRPGAAARSPKDESVLADSVGAALLAVLDTLPPAQRLAFVLHDTFGVPFGRIGAILGRSDRAAKQLAHRARRRVRGAGPAVTDDRVRHRKVVDAFLAASRQGDFEALVRLLDPDAVLVADPAAVRMGASARVSGAAGVAAMFSGRAQAARPALIDGGVGIVWAVRGNVRVAWDLAIEEDRITHINMLADPDTLAHLVVTRG